MRMKITIVELVGTKLACRARAAVARGILPSPDPDSRRCQASMYSSAGSSKIKSPNLIFDGPAELEA